MIMKSFNFDSLYKLYLTEDKSPKESYTFQIGDETCKTWGVSVKQAKQNALYLYAKEKGEHIGEINAKVTNGKLKIELVKEDISSDLGLRGTQQNSSSSNQEQQVKPVPVQLPTNNPNNNNKPNQNNSSTQATIQGKVNSILQKHIDNLSKDLADANLLPATQKDLLQKNIGTALYNQIAGSQVPNGQQNNTPPNMSPQRPNNEASEYEEIKQNNLYKSFEATPEQYPVLRAHIDSGWRFKEWVPSVEARYNGHANAKLVKNGKMIEVNCRGQVFAKL